MKKIKLFSIFLLFFIFFYPTSILACGGFEMFSGQGQMVHSTDETNVFVSFKDGQETLVVQPDFTGNAKQFGVVLPFPSKPVISPAPSLFFQLLREITRPFKTTNFGTLGSALPQSGGGVTVIAIKDVGDFETTTLTATSTDDLITWLKDHDFAYSTKDKANFSYYVEKEGYYFVALKVKLDKVQTDAKGMLQGSLKPLAFSFKSDKPIVAMRISASTMKPMNYDLYTSGTEMYFVPGAQIDYSAEVKKEDLNESPVLKSYITAGDWLTHSIVRMDPGIIEQDLILTQAIKPEPISNSSFLLNPDNVPKEAGIVLGAATKTKKIAFVQITPTTTPMPTITLSLDQTHSPIPTAIPSDKNISTVFWVIIIGGLGVEVIGGLLLIKFIRRS